MEKNKAILDKWYESFKDLPKLKWKEMKVIYEQMLLCDNDKEKKVLQNKLILGSMHAFYHFFQNSIFMQVSFYPMEFEDMLSECVECWIQNLVDKGIRNYSSLSVFYYFLETRFFRKIEENIKMKEYSYMQNLKIPKEKLLLFLQKYVVFRTKQNDVSLKEFLSFFNGEVASTYYSMFEEIYNRIEKNKMVGKISFEEEKLSQELEFVLSIFLNEYLLTSFNPKDMTDKANLLTDNSIDQVNRNIMQEKVREYLEKVEFYSTRNKQFLLERHGFYDIPKSVIQIAEEWGVSRQVLDKKNQKAYKQMRRLDSKEHELLGIYEELSR